MASLVFVILNEVKNLAHPTDKILRCAQDDKQGAGKDGFAWWIGSTTRFSLVKVSGASNHALRLRNRNKQVQFPAIRATNIMLPYMRDYYWVGDLYPYCANSSSTIVIPALAPMRVAPASTA